MRKFKLKQKKTNNFMKAISASYVVTCDENNRIIKDGAVVFDDKIVEINTLF